MTAISNVEPCCEICKLVDSPKSEMPCLMCIRNRTHSDKFDIHPVAESLITGTLKGMSDGN